MRRLFRRWWFWLIVVLVLPLPWQVLQLRHSLHEHRIEQQVAEWRNRAAMASTGAFTPDDAVKWLQQNRFEAIAIGFGHESGPGVERDDSEVKGSMQVANGSFLLEPAYVHIVFCFTPDEKQFLDVSAYRMPAP